MYNMCVFTCIVFIIYFIVHNTHVRMSYVLNAYLITYLRLNTNDIVRNFTQSHPRRLFCNLLWY